MKQSAVEVIHILTKCISHPSKVFDEMLNIKNTIAPDAITENYDKLIDMNYTENVAYKVIMSIRKHYINV